MPDDVRKSLGETALPGVVEYPTVITVTLGLLSDTVTGTVGAPALPSTVSKPAFETETVAITPPA